MTKLSYHVVYPARLLEDTELPSTAFRLYGFISGLTRREGYCWAKNDSLAELMGTTVRTVQNALNSLLDRGYISLEIVHNVRRIYLVDLTRLADEEPEIEEEQDCTGDEKNFTPCKKNHGGVKKSSSRGEKNCTPYKRKNNNREKEVEKEDARAFGTYGNVFLTDKQFDRLCEWAKRQDVLDMADEMSCAIQSKKVKPYQDFEAALRNWLRKAGKLKKPDDRPTGRAQEWA